MAALTLAAIVPSSSSALPPSIYWANYSNGVNSGTISKALLDDGGGSAVGITGAPAATAFDGTAIDAAAGRIYWASRGSNKIEYANLDGSGAGAALNTTGATVSGPSGVAIDRPAGRIYWANSSASKISYANLDGGGGGDLNTTGGPVGVPEGVAIDRAGGRIYWANTSLNSIAYAKLDGTGGGGTLNTIGSGISSPVGPAIDPVARKIYWSDFTPGGISYANLDGSGAGALNTTGATLSHPAGTAVDHAHNRVYWTNYDAGKISYANLSNTGAGGDLNLAGAGPDGPFGSPSLLLTPVVATGTPADMKSRSARLRGAVNPDGDATTYAFDYGRTTSYGARVPGFGLSAGSGIASSPVSQPLTGLRPHTTYHFRIVAVNGFGTVFGADRVFTTKVAPPSVTTKPPRGVARTSAALRGLVNPNGLATRYRFIWGTTAKYGRKTSRKSAGHGFAARGASAKITGLKPNTVYHYRLVAVSSAGTKRGKDRKFRTRG